MKAPDIVRAVIGGTFGLLFLGLLAKDGSQLGTFFNSSQQAASNYVKTLSQIG